MKANHAIHLGREALVVRGNKRSAAFAADEAEKLVEDGIGGMLVKIAGRLVGKHQRRLVGERSGDRDPLLLATR